jgi:hypothetical protein
VKKATLLATPRAKSKGTKEILIWFDCWCLQSVVPLDIYNRGSLDPFLGVPQQNP